VELLSRNLAVAFGITFIFLGLSLVFMTLEGLSASVLPQATLSTQHFAPCQDCHQDPAQTVQGQWLRLGNHRALRRDSRYQAAQQEAQKALALGNSDSARQHWQAAALLLAPLVQEVEYGAYEAVVICRPPKHLILALGAYTGPKNLWAGPHRLHLGGDDFARRLDTAIIYMLLAGMMLILHRRAPPAEAATGCFWPTCFPRDCWHSLPQSFLFAATSPAPTGRPGLAFTQHLSFLIISQKEPLIRTP
jgi:hypothetical protein